MEFSIVRLAVIVGVAVAAHAIVVAIRAATRGALRSRTTSETKVHTVTSFGSSLLVFAIYFGAVGFILSELGVSLTTYLASASVIGLAVSFGSQGVVQDVITGLTVVFSDLLDVGDMVDLGGQVGIVESVGMRFTVMVNFSGARVFVPNRSIMSVVNFPDGYTRAYIDARLPADSASHDATKQTLAACARASFEQYSGILLIEPSIEGPYETTAGFSFVRLKFRIWPGQGPLLENAIKPALTEAVKSIDANYAPWMMTVHYRSESLRDESDQRLPRPSAVRMRLAAARAGVKPPRIHRG